MRRDTTPAIAAALFAGHALAACVTLESPAPAANATPRAYSTAWQQDIDVAGAPRLTVGRTAVFVVSAESGLTAYDAIDGRRLWTIAAQSDAAPVAIGDVVGVLSEGSLGVFDQTSGRQLWRAAYDGQASPLRIQAVNGMILASIGRDLRTWRADGTLVWEARLPAAPTTRVVSRADALFVGLDTPELVAIDPTRGELRERSTLPAQPLSLTAHGEHLYFAGSDRALHAYRTRKTLRRAWRFPGHQTIGEPAADDERVYFTLVDNTLRAFARGGGSQRWTTPLAARAAAGPLFGTGNVFVALSNGQLAQFSASSGHPVATPASPSQVRLNAVAATDGAAWIFTIVTAGNNTRTLAAWSFVKK